MVTSLESFKNNKVVLLKIAATEEPEKKQQLIRSPAHSSGRHTLA